MTDYMEAIWFDIRRWFMKQAERLHRRRMIPHLTKVRYCFGPDVLFEEPFVYRRLWRNGDMIVHDWSAYEVVSVRLEGTTERVQLFRTREATLRRQGR